MNYLPPPDSAVVSNTISRNFRYSEFSPVGLAPANSPATNPENCTSNSECPKGKQCVKGVFSTPKSGSGMICVPIECRSVKCAVTGEEGLGNGLGCAANLQTSIRTGNWEEFQGLTNWGNIASCVLWAAVIALVGVGIAIVLGVGGPVIAPIADVVLPIVGNVFRYGWSLIKWVAGGVYDVVMEGVDTLGVNRWVFGVTLVTALAWGVAEVMLKSLGVWRLWSDSAFGTIFRFIDTPIEILVTLAGGLGNWASWLAWILLLPFEAGAFVVSLVLGGIWELVRYGWNAVTGKRSNT